MRTTRMLGGLAVVLLSPWSTRAEPMPSRITQPEVTVRSGPSSEFYPTSRLHRGDAVYIVREEAGGWLAIVPPRGSFSWIHASLVEQIVPNAVVVSAPEAQIWVGSRLLNTKPTVWRKKVTQGTQLTMIGRAEVAPDGTWLPILPAPAEVRYIPATAVSAGKAVSQSSAAPSEPVRTAATSADFASPQPIDKGTVPLSSKGNDSVAQPASSSTALSSLQLQAEEAERAGNIARATELWEELARQAAGDHGLWVRSHNHLQALQEPSARGITVSPAGLPSAANTDNARANGRLSPMPSSFAGPPGSAFSSLQRPGVPSQYCYVQDSGYTARLSTPVASSPNPPPTEQWYEPGTLRRATFSVDGRPLYCLQPLKANQRHIYVTAAANVNLEPYVEKNVYLCGPMVYRGDLRTYYMTVVQVSPLH